MNPRRLRALATIAATAALVACTSSGGGDSGEVPEGMPTDARGLATMLRTAVLDISTAHLTLAISLAGQKLTGEGDEKLSNGKLEALDLTEKLPGDAGSIRIISVGGKSYAKLPADLNKSDKPWLIVSEDSSNTVIRQLASALDTALTSASLASVGTFAQAAKSIKLKGTSEIDGQTTTHYSFEVDISKLPASLPGKDQLEASGLKTLPIELYVDADGRPVRVTENLEVQGQQVSTTATITDYDKPVTITAPPANQIGS